MTKLKHSLNDKSKLSLLFSRRYPRYNKAMLKIDTEEQERLKLAERVKEAISSMGRGGKTKIAKVCRITPQSVNGWISTGKIDKNNLAVVAKMTGYRLDWLITGKGEKLEDGELSPFDNAGFSLSENTKIIRTPAVPWSEYCKNTDSINKIKELDFMIIENGINVSEEIYALDIDTNTFSKFPAGTRILIDPKMVPEKDNTVILSIDDGIPTLVRWNPGLGLLQVEPLEDGFPNSISLDGKNYTVLGVAVWQHQKGGRL